MIAGFKSILKGCNNQLKQSGDGYDGVQFQKKCQYMHNEEMSHKQLKANYIIKWFNNNMQGQHINTANSEQIVNCFNELSLLLCNDTNQIRKGQQGLLKLSLNPTFIQHLLKVPQISGISTDIAKLAITYAKTYVRNLESAHKHTQLMTAADHIINFIATAKVQFKLKQQLATTLQYILQKEKSKALLPSIQQKLSTFLSDSLAESNPQLINFQLLAILSNSVIESLSSPIINHSQFLQKTFLHVVQISLYVSKLLPPAMQSWETQVQIGHALNIMRLFLDVVLKYLRKILLFNFNVLHSVNKKEIVQLINNCLNLNLPDNSQQVSIFYVAKDKNNTSNHKQNIVQIFHKVKHNTLRIITQCSQLIMMNTQQYMKTQLFAQGQRFIPAFVNGVTVLLAAHNYYNLQSKTQIYMIQQIYKYLLLGLNSHGFYNAFLQMKTRLIFGCVLKALAFSPEDYHNFSQDPEEFVNSLYQILEIQPDGMKQRKLGQEKKKQQIKSRVISNELASKKQKNQIKDANTMQIEQAIGVQGQSQQQNITEDITQANKQNMSPQDQVQIFDNLKTNSAKLYISYLQNIDASLAELSAFCFSILDSRTVQTVFKKDAIFLAICLMKNLVKDNQNIKYQIGQVLVLLMRYRQLPIKSKQQDLDDPNPQNVQYAMNLIALQQYLPLINPYAEQLCESLFIIIEQLLMNPMVEEVPKLLTSYLIRTILKTDTSTSYAQKSIQLLNCMITPSNLNLKYLESLEQSIQQVEYQLKFQQKAVVRLLNKISSVLSVLLQEQEPNTIIINKLWHILQQISVSEHLMPNMREPMQESLQQILPFISGRQQFIVQQRIYKIAVNMMKSTTIASSFDMQLLEIIKTNFYKGPSKNSFANSFQILQHIIFLGRLTLEGDINQIKALVQMCCHSIRLQWVDDLPRSESQFVQGVLMMESIIISLGRGFDRQAWAVCLQTVYQKYKQTTITYDFLKAELITNMAIIVAFAGTSFTDEEISKVLPILLKDHYCFSYKNAAKTYITSMIQMLALTEAPFVQRHYIQILDCVITVLMLIKQGKDIALERQHLDSQETQFFKYKQMSLNCINPVDEFNLFKNQMQRVKNQNPQLFQYAISGLAENKMQYMREILTVRKVLDEVRVIYKLKHHPA